MWETLDVKGKPQHSTTSPASNQLNRQNVEKKKEVEASADIKWANCEERREKGEGKMDNLCKTR